MKKRKAKSKTDESDDEQEYCHPIDGMYEQGHRECEKCNVISKRVCVLYSYRRGMSDLKDLYKQMGEYND